MKYEIQENKWMTERIWEKSALFMKHIIACKIFVCFEWLLQQKVHKTPLDTHSLGAEVMVIIDCKVLYLWSTRNSCFNASLYLEYQALISSQQFKAMMNYWEKVFMYCIE